MNNFFGILGLERIIDVVEMESGRAEEGTAAILQVLQEWGVTAHHIIGCSFDTTNTNSGAHSGIVVRLERAFNKKLLHFYCRHHCYERFELLSIIIYVEIKFNAFQI